MGFYQPKSLNLLDRHNYITRYMGRSRYDDSILRDGISITYQDNITMDILDIMKEYGYNSPLAAKKIADIIEWYPASIVLRYKTIIEAINTIALLKCPFARVKIDTKVIDDEALKNSMLEGLKARLFRSLNQWRSDNYAILANYIEQNESRFKEIGLIPINAKYVVYQRLISVNNEYIHFGQIDKGVFVKDVESAISYILSCNYQNLVFRVNFDDIINADNELLDYCLSLFEQPQVSLTQIHNENFSKNAFSIINKHLDSAYDFVLWEYEATIEAQRLGNDSPEAIYVEQLSSAIVPLSDTFPIELSPANAAQYFYFVLTDSKNIIAKDGYLPNPLARVIYDILVKYWNLKDGDNLDDEEKKKRIRRYFAISPETGTYQTIR